MRLWIDTETGGLNCNKYDLLTIGIVVENNGLFIAQQEFGIKRDEYRTTKSAMDINKINLNHLQDDPVQVIKTIKRIVKECFKDEKPIIYGQNTQFDLGFLKIFFDEFGTDGESKFNDIFSGRIFDIYTVANYLIDIKKLPQGTTSLSKMVKHFNINKQGRHTALSDAKMTASVYHKMLQIGGMF